MLDDASTDNTVAAVLEVARETRVEALVTKSEWLRNEAQDKNILLRTARRLGGTAFIVVRLCHQFFSSFCLGVGVFARLRVIALVLFTAALVLLLLTSFVLA